MSDPTAAPAAPRDRGPRPLRFAGRMSSSEALMWAAERDPLLRSSFLTITFLDRPPDHERFRTRLGRAVTELPRLRQRVKPARLPGQPPAWVDDASFDLDFHVRRIGLAAPGTDRQLLDLAALEAEDAFDPSRPLWRYTIVEGLTGGRAALLAKMHHTITDGVGGVRLSASFLDLERDAPDPPPAVPGEVAPGRSLAEDAWRTAMRTARSAAQAATHPLDVVANGRAVLRQSLVSGTSRSPIWTSRSLARRFEILTVELDRAKAAAKDLGGSLNDLLVAAVAGGAGAYHRSVGHPVGELRVAMPVSTRDDRSAGGNAFAPSRLLVSVDEDPVVRFADVHRRLSVTKADPALRMLDDVAGVLALLPAPVVSRFARTQAATVDFAVSNVRGAPFELYVGGAKVLANHPMGPLAATAFNATLLSYLDRMDIGLNVDPAAVSDPALLRDLVVASFDELFAAAGR